ncbi:MULTISPECIES: YafY family protein [unclassified Fibrobacter]|jgi:predicted DNA-binding transcriptional regulator YafY|uniref:helix-turn-helix transcriptional regulator n=1 Tax=unclassified Fibrobacter TaxID=2634177 RepID=UPI0009190177|nr:MULTISPECIES: WYL domain-containing protein [unclassified Fibrobacter]SHM58402.1 Predicted DNA-binding transcriptional regulator YafY, contains an HTH and WYL domains [Fibrobacter sp. UWB7]SMG08776.1 Predicted DNA-binding transcriptional regulator YafY, contains an HTH and WYL domains [Fibrobacter sp. UWB13]
MADMTRGERTVQLFAKVISNPEKKFTINDLMESFNIPAEERRNVQRDMRFLSEMDGGRYIAVDTVGRTSYYTSALRNAERLLFPNFENTMLHFVFLKRIANIYPATSETITQLLERIEKSLPNSEQKTLRHLGDELNSKILFMGTPPDFEEDSSEKLRIILQAIHEHRKIDVFYMGATTFMGPSTSERKSTRIPLMIIVYQNEIYVACESEKVKGATYTLKFRRILQVKLSKETFVENPKVIDKLRRQVASGAAFMSEQEPHLEDIEIEFEWRVRNYLMENKFNQSMHMRVLRNAKILVTMKADVNQLLVNWITSYTTAARVIKPASLRNSLRDYAKYLLENYGE